MKGPRVFLLLAALATFPGRAQAQDATVAGTLTSPYPTVIHLSLEWRIQGDANFNATAGVEFRAVGETTWKTGMPLRRVAAGSNQGFTWPDKLAGSLFHLAPDTPYEIRVALADPDGGGETRALTARTRPVPAIPPGAVVVDVPAGSHGVLNPPSGTAASPRVYRYQGGSASAVYDFVDLTGKQHVWLWGLTLRSSGANNRAAVKMNNSEGIVIRHCTVDALYGIVAYAEGTRNAYIGDNVITGKVGWADSTMGADGANEGEGVEITGPGNVVAFNRVAGFRDAISLLEDDGAAEQVSIDIYNNDISVGADDAVEADFCMGNCRVLDNRIVNSYVGLSSQPSLGGPTYFIRNALYNVVHAAFKLKRGSRGDVVLHNTVVKVGAGLAGNDAMDWAYFRNNLAFGGPDGGIDWGGYGAGNPYAADILSPGSHSSFDYDGVGVSGTAYVARIGGADFATVEPHGLANLDFAATFSGLSFPNPPVPERAWPDLRPASGSRPVDAGLRIPNINDAYLGSGPDIGAYEQGQVPPHYGPRPKGVEEGTLRSGTPRAVPREPGFTLHRAVGGLAIRFPDREINREVTVSDPLGKSRGRFSGRGEILVPSVNLPGGVIIIRTHGRSGHTVMASWDGGY